MKIHPAAALFPMMTDEEFNALVDDIREWGQREPIELLDDEVLDGRNRLRACEQLAIRPITHDLTLGSQSPTAYVISKNLHRRNLTISQRATIAVEALPLFEDEAKQRMLRGTRQDDPGANLRQGKPMGRQPKSSTRAAQTTEVSSRIVEEAKALKEQAPELFDKVKAGEMTVHSAAKALGRKSGGNRRNRTRKMKLAEAIGPLLRYLKDWNEDRLYGVTPKEARKLLKDVQEIDQVLLEVERALEERTVVSRALR